MVQRGGGGAAEFIEKITNMSFDELKKAADAAITTGQTSFMEDEFDDSPEESELSAYEEEEDQDESDEDYA